jgi:hypothetical protein
MPANIPSQAYFVLAFIAGVLVLLSARSVIRVIVRPIRRVVSFVVRRIVLPVLRFLLRPMLRWLRRLKFVGRLFSPTRQSSPLAATIPYKLFVLFLEKESLASTALGDVPASVRDLVTRTGWIFRTVNANRAAEQLQEALTLDDACTNLDLSTKYYENDVESERTSPGILYEDSEEALIIEILRDSDTPFFWALRTLRRNVSRNIVKILAIMTAIVGIFPFAIECVIARLTPRWGLNEWVIYLMVIAGFLFFMYLVRYMLYGFSATTNGQKLNYFVQTYFSRLLNQYQSARAAFSNILNGRTATLDTVEINSKIWFTNMHWISARQWLLGLYVRNIAYQFLRDRLWHLLFVPASVIILLVLLYTVWHYIAVFLVDIGIQSATAMSMNWGPLTLVPLAVLFAFYLFAWSGLLHRFWDEIRSQGWPSFRNMNIKQVIESDIGPIVRELIAKRRNPMGSS